MDAPPPFPRFSSHPTAANGRAYELGGGVRLVAYAIPDPQTIPGIVGAGFYVYALTLGSRVGFWHHTTAADDLCAVMDAFTAAASCTPMGELPPRLAQLAQPRAGGGQLPHVQHLHLDVGALLRGEGQPRSAGSVALGVLRAE